MVDLPDVGWPYILHNSIGCEVKKVVSETVITPDFKRLQEPIENHSDFYGLFKFPKVS